MSDLCNVIMNEKTNAKLSNLTSKKDKDLYIYYCHTKDFLKKMYRQNQVTNSSRDITIFNLSK